jgi:hypothetical protein
MHGLSADHSRRVRAFIRLALMVALGLGCATTPEPALERHPEIAAQIAEAGLQDDPAVEAARERLEAAIAAEPSDVAVDGVEIRAVVAKEEFDTVGALVRLPIANPMEINARRETRRAETELALAELAEVTHTQSLILCEPSVRHLALEEHKRIYERYAERNRALLEWNEELGRAGLLDEVRVRRFDLASRVRLATRDPNSIPSPLALLGSDRIVDVLPEPSSKAPLLRSDRESLHEHLMSHQPTVGVHRASRKRLEALAQTESAKRLPSLRFVDFGFEPVVSPGQTRSWAARVAVDVPFGRAASATRKQYEALARAEVSDEREVVARRVDEAWWAISEINAFRREGQRWLDLAALADSAEELADRWWQDRLTNPGEIANLLDSVYSARLAVLDARERAGLADCAMIAATGRSASESE